MVQFVGSGSVLLSPVLPIPLPCNCVLSSSQHWPAGRPSPPFNDPFRWALQPPPLPNPRSTAPSSSLTSSQWHPNVTLSPRQCLLAAGSSSFCQPPNVLKLNPGLSPFLLTVHPPLNILNALFPEKPLISSKNAQFIFQFPLACGLHHIPMVSGKKMWVILLPSTSNSTSPKILNILRLNIRNLLSLHRIHVWSMQ